MTGTESGAAEQPKKALTVRGATFLGVGSMIGAGIFALLGEAGAVAGAAVWLSFLVGASSRSSPSAATRRPGRFSRVSR